MSFQGRMVGRQSPAELGWSAEGGPFEAFAGLAFLGGGGNLLKQQIITILRERGVPANMIEARASGVMSSLGGSSGLKEVFAGADLDEVWRRLKWKADQAGFRLVLKSELGGKRGPPARGGQGQKGQRLSTRSGILPYPPKGCPTAG